MIIYHSVKGGGGGRSEETEIQCVLSAKLLIIQNTAFEYTLFFIRNKPSAFFLEVS